MRVLGMIAYERCKKTRDLPLATEALLVVPTAVSVASSEWGLCCLRVFSIMVLVFCVLLLCCIPA